MAIVGIDAGGSKTRLVALDTESNQTVADRTLGPANWATSSPDAWCSVMTEALAGLKSDAIVVCAAGIVSQANRAAASELIAKISPKAWVRVKADYFAPLGLVPLGVVVVIAGTGSVVVTASNDRVAKAGGNGYLLGDEGSLVDIGKRAIRLYVAGEGEDLGPVFADLDPSDVVSAVYDAINPVTFLSEIGKRVLATYPAGEPVVAEALYALAAVAAKLKPADAVALTGGLWSLRPDLSATFQRALNDYGLAVSCYVIAEEPVLGAVKLARLLFDEHGSPKSPLLQP